MASEDNFHIGLSMPAAPQLRKESEVFVRVAEACGACVAEWIEGPETWHLHVEFEIDNVGVVDYLKWMKESLPPEIMNKFEAHARPDRVQ
jgi:hypothetical protein